MSGAQATLTLASRSPQRRAILEQLGVDFTAVTPRAEEIDSGDPESLVLENAARKARSVPGDLVLGVDTAVAIDGRAFGKPHDEDQAGALLRRLSGRSHAVLSGLLLRDGAAEHTVCIRTVVHFRRLGSRELRWYLETEEWRERAGGYAIQGRGAALVMGIEGDFWNVVGLPVAALLDICPTLLYGPRAGARGGR